MSEREAGYDYALGAAYSAAMAAMATARDADGPGDADTPWEGDEPGPAFNAGAAEAVADLAALRAEDDEGGREETHEKPLCENCGAELIDAMGGSVCPNC